MQKVSNKVLSVLFQTIDVICQNADLEEEKILKAGFASHLLHYILAIVAADRKVDYQEVEFINDMFRTDYTVDGLIEIIKGLEEQYPLMSSDFSTYPVPDYIKILSGADLRHNCCISRKLVKALETLGVCVMAINEEFHPKQSELISNYTAYLNDWLNDAGVVQIEEENSSIAQEEEIDEISTNELDTLLNELNNLIGLPKLKQDVNNIINFIKVRNLRNERGMTVAPMSFHLVFSGNPGTGKTTVARLLAQIYHSLGLLSKGHLVEVDRSGLIAGYIGQTAIKVQEVIQKSLGGVLFIDEAYALTAGRAEQDYGAEAIETILKAMEDNRHDLIVIVAGYPSLMDEFLNTNPGLRSRFNKFIYFEDYCSEELQAIFVRMCEKAGYKLTPQAETASYEYFKRSCGSDTFANARGVRNFFEMAIYNQANRVAAISNPTTEDLETIKQEDLPDTVLNGSEKGRSRLHEHKIGF